MTAELKSAMTTPHLREPSVGDGDAAWCVEATAEVCRRREHGTQASNKLLALLQAHHDYGAGELMLTGGRRLSTGRIANG